MFTIAGGILLALLALVGLYVLFVLAVFGWSVVTIAVHRLFHGRPGSKRP